MQRAQLTELVLKLDREDQSLRAENHSGDSGVPAIIQPYGEEKRQANSRRAITYGAVCLPFLFLLVFMWIQPDFNRQETPDWKPVFALGDVAREKGDWYNAKALYSQAGKFAARREDWAGLLAAACGMKKLETERGPHPATNALLLHAMVAAEARQSRIGTAAVAKAFAALEEEKVASMVSSRIQKSWPEEINDSRYVVLSDCWDKQPGPNR